MDYVLNVLKDGKFLYAIGGNHMNYDNVIWWQLETLIKTINDLNDLSSDKLLELIQEKCEYFTNVLDKPYADEPVLDLTNKTISVNHINLFNLDEVTMNNVERELVKVDGVYKIMYEFDEEPFDIDYVQYDLELLSKKVFTYDELLKVANFINGLLKENKTDCIVNNEKALLLTEI